jgi:hypothetical protein
MSIRKFIIYNTGLDINYFLSFFIINIPIMLFILYIKIYIPNKNIYTYIYGAIISIIILIISFFIRDFIKSYLMENQEELEYFIAFILIMTTIDKVPINLEGLI